MTSPPTTDRARLQIEGEVTLERTDELLASPSPQDDGTLSLSGRLTSKRSGMPLRGLRAIARQETDEPHDQVLGEATSDAGGYFTIQFKDSRDVRGWLAALRHSPDARMRLRVATADDHNLYTSDPLPFSK